MFDFEQMLQYQQMQKNGMFPAIQLPTVADVEKFQPQRGMTMVVMAQDKPVFALKAADQMGVTKSAWYKYETYNPEQDKPQYITRGELEEVLAKFAQSITAQSITSPPKRANDQKTAASDK